MEYAAFSYSPRSNRSTCEKLSRKLRFFVDNAIVAATKTTILALALHFCV
jgi:hypothetical protein